MKELLFDLKFVFRNVFSRPLRFFSILISIIIIFVFSFLLFGSDKIIYTATMQKQMNNYNNFDFYVCIKENSNKRFYSFTSSIKKNIPDYDQKILQSASFLTIPQYYQAENKAGNINVMLGNINEFKLLISTEVSVLKSDEVIISKSFSEKYNIKEDLSICFNGKDYLFKVKDICEGGVFDNQAIFLDKEYGAKILNIGIISSLLGDMCNISYFKLRNETIDVEGIFNDLSQTDLKYDYCASEKSIEAAASIYYSTLKIIFAFILLIIFLVLNSLFKRMLQEKRDEYLTLSFLGGGKGYFAFLTGLELFIYYAIGGIIGYFAYYFIRIFLGRIIYPGYINVSDGLSTIFGLIFVFVIILILFILGMLWFRGESIQQKKAKKNSYYYVSLIMLMIIFAFAHLLPYKYRGICIVLLAFLVAVVIIKVIFIIINNLPKRGVFPLFNLNVLANNRLYYQSIKLLVCCLLGISMILSIKSYIITNSTSYTINCDFNEFLFNVYKYDDEFKNDIMNNTSLMKECDYYRSIKLLNYDYLIDVSFACDSNNFNDFYLFDTTKVDLSKLDSMDNYIYLNETLRVLYNLDIGEELLIDFGTEVKSVYVAGFMDFGMNNMAFLSKGLIRSISCILVKGISDDFYPMLQNYTKKMFYLNSPQDFAESFFKSAVKTTNFISALCIVIILMLFLVIINNSLLFFEEMKNEYGKLRLLGLSQKEFIVNSIKEIIFVLFISLAICFIGSIIQINNIGYILIFFNTYFEITLSPASIIKGLGIGGFAYILSQLIFIYKACRINIIDNIKRF